MDTLICSKLYFVQIVSCRIPVFSINPPINTGLVYWIPLNLVKLTSTRLGDQDKLRDHEREIGCVLVYRYTKEGNNNELRHNSMYGYENKRNSLVYRYTRTAPGNLTPWNTDLDHFRVAPLHYRLPSLLHKLNLLHPFTLSPY